MHQSFIFFLAIIHTELHRAISDVEVMHQQQQPGAAAIPRGMEPYAQAVQALGRGLTNLLRSASYAYGERRSPSALRPDMASAFESLVQMHGDIVIEQVQLNDLICIANNKAWAIRIVDNNAITSTIVVDQIG